MIKAFLRKVGLLSKKVVISRDQHQISRQHISKNALKVLYRLNNHGYEAYLVGGGVRDLLLGNRPKDFDVVTNAKPEEVRKIFRNCRLIGRRFRLAHIYFGYDIVEVATFRGKALEANDDHMHSEEGMILRDNVYGTLAEDVTRRDFTINALYYNIADYSLVDYVGGLADLKAKRLKIIGDPFQRFREDPVRMLRAIRFASKTQFKLSQNLKDAMKSLKSLIFNVSSSRLYEEIIKMFHFGHALDTYFMLKEEKIFEMLFPNTHDCFKQKSYPTDQFLQILFKNTDLRYQEEKTLNPAFIVAGLLWHPICIRAQRYAEDGTSHYIAKTRATEEVLAEQTKLISMPRRITQATREIWFMQPRLERRQNKRINLLITEARFRAAYDFLELRAKAGEEVKEAAKWWQEYVEGDTNARKALLTELEPPRRKPKRRKRKPEKGETQ